MPSRSPVNPFVPVVLALVLIAVISGIMLIPSVLSILQPPRTETQNQPSTTATDSLALQRARAILARVRAEAIPEEGSSTDYAVTFTDAGYETLMKWNTELAVEGRYADAFESMNLMLPCCEWGKPSRDEKTNCACGHHQALEGLSKKLLSEERSAMAVQLEVTRWASYLYPKETLAAEMEKRAQLDPEIKAALEELKARGEC